MTAWTTDAEGVFGVRRAPLRASVGWLRTAAGSVPPSGLVLLSIASVQVGAALAKELFATLSPTTVVMLRLAFAAVVLVPLWRPRLAGRSRGDLALAAAFGVGLAGMNLAFYEAISRIPLGVAVTIEFLGPLTIAVIGSRRRMDLLWVVLAAAGVALLTRGGGTITPAGVAFALLAAAGWATYILLSAATGRRFAGSTGLALATALGAALTLPLGLHDYASLADPTALAVGAGVALLSSVVPYSLEMEALRRMPPRVFGLLMSLEPAVAALAGFLILGEVLGAREWLAVAFVVVACVGTTRNRREAGPPEP